MAGGLLGFPPAQGDLDPSHLRLLEHQDRLGVGQPGNRPPVHREYLVPWETIPDADEREGKYGQQNPLTDGQTLNDPSFETESIPHPI